MLDQRALAEGSAMPPQTPDKLRLYNMRFCPWTHITRLVLAHKGIDYETVNINLANKPKWFLDKTAIGLVPVLERNDHIVCDSRICNEYVEKVCPDKQLIPSDPYLQAQHQMIFEFWKSKVIPRIHDLRNTTDVEAVKQQLHSALEYMEKALGQGKYFGGDSVSLLDFSVWPYMERLPVVEEEYKIELVSENRLPKLYNWVKLMHENEAVKAHHLDLDQQKKFLMSYRNKKPDYDIGLD